MPGDTASSLDAATPTSASPGDAAPPPGERAMLSNLCARLPLLAGGTAAGDGATAMRTADAGVAAAGGGRKVAVVGRVGARAPRGAAGVVARGPPTMGRRGADAGVTAAGTLRRKPPPSLPGVGGLLRAASTDALASCAASLATAKREGGDIGGGSGERGSGGFDGGTATAAAAFSATAAAHCRSAVAPPHTLSASNAAPPSPATMPVKTPPSPPAPARAPGGGIAGDALARGTLTAPTESAPGAAASLTKVKAPATFAA